MFAFVEVGIRSLGLAKNRSLRRIANAKHCLLRSGASASAKASRCELKLRVQRSGAFGDAGVLCEVGAISF